MRVHAKLHVFEQNVRLRKVGLLILIQPKEKEESGQSMYHTIELYIQVQEIANASLHRKIHVSQRGGFGEVSFERKKKGLGDNLAL